MCIALPMQVVEALPGAAWVEGMGHRRRVDMALVGAQPVGTWVLVFLDAAREVVDARRAAEVAAALTALERAMSGDTADLDSLFPDLACREPELPAFLRDRLPRS